MDRDVLRGAVAACRAAAGAAADLLLPRACVVCEGALDAAEPELVCGRCWLRAEELPRPRCDRCGHPCAAGPASVRRHEGSTSPLMGRDPCAAPPARAASCRWCALLPPFVRSARSAFAIPGGTAEQVVHAVKYDGWHAAAAGMARRMAALRFPEDVERERAALVPVPLAATRLRERGFNQSHALASGLSRIWGVPVADGLLERGRATRSQTRLTPGERTRNVSGAFHARASRASLRGLHLVLVDDVVTTAATLNACAAALHDGGARILSFVTFGRAPAPGDRW